MPDVFLTGSAEGLVWLLGAVIVAGIVRGFSGFGSAMIIMPVASSVLTPVQAVIFLTAAEIFGPLPNLPAALRQGAPRDIGRLILGAVIALPFGLWVLTVLDPELFGWVISGLVLVLLALLVTGWRFHGAMTRRLVIGTGGLGGFMTGFAGMPGPPVIMLYMASALPVSVIRANLMLYLFAVDLVLFPVLWLSGLMVWPVFFLGLLIGVPNLIANMIGARLFNPDASGLFRTVAYLVIFCSAILGLPIWTG